MNINDSSKICYLIILLNIVNSVAQKNVVPLVTEESTQDSYISIARVEKGDKVGYVNGWGEEILPVEFDEGSFQYFENRIRVRQGENWYIYDVEGNLLLDLKDKYKFVGYSGDDLFFVTNTVTRQKSNYYFHYQFNYDELKFIDLSGQEKVSIKHGLRLYTDYPTTLRLDNGLLKLEVSACKSCANKLIGFVNKKGEIVVDPIFHPADTKYLYNEGLLFVAKDGTSKYKALHGFIDEGGNWVIDPTYRYRASSYFVDGAAIVDSTVIKNDPFNKSTMSNTFLINHQGERVFARDVHIMRNIGIVDSIVVVEKYFGEQLKFALAKTDGTFNTDFKYDNIISFHGHGHYLASIGEEQWYLDKNGNRVNHDLKPFEGKDEEVYTAFSRPSNYKDGLAIIYGKEKQTSVVDMEGSVIKTFDDKYPSFEGGLIIITVQDPNNTNEWIKQYYDRNGKLIVFKEYDKIFDFQFLKL